MPVRITAIGDGLGRRNTQHPPFPHGECCERCDVLIAAGLLHKVECAQVHTIKPEGENCETCLPNKVCAWHFEYARPLSEFVSALHVALRYRLEVSVMKRVQSAGWENDIVFDVFRQRKTT